MSESKTSNLFFDNRLRASERLKSSRDIEALFKSSKSSKAYPLRLVYTLQPRAVAAPNEADPAGMVNQHPPARVGFVASKRGIKKAVDRNFIKRRMRESYRLEKSELYAWLQAGGVEMQAMLIYTGRELPTQIELTKAWKKLLRRLDPSFF